MKTLTAALFFLTMSAALIGCSHYTGVSKADGDLVYVTGSTSYIIFGTTWVKKCKDDGEKLTGCKTLQLY